MSNQERIEQAVIALWGEWPVEDCASGDYLVFGDGIREYFSKPIERPPIHGYEEYICTYAKFMKTRARLESEGRLGQAPECSDPFQEAWSAVCKTLYKVAPELMGTGEGSGVDRAVATIKHLAAHKTPNPAEWEPGADLPPVGVECRWMDDDGTWLDAKCIGYDGPAAVMAVDGVGYRAVTSAKMVRPAQSRRDKVIESADRALGNRFTPHFQEDIFGGLYDAGLLKLPEGEG